MEEQVEEEVEEGVEEEVEEGEGGGRESNSADDGIERELLWISDSSCRWGS